MWDQADAVISALDGSDRRIVLRNAPAARYVETGHLVYAASDRLMAAPFDVEARRVIGDTVPLPEPVNAPRANEVGIIAVTGEASVSRL